MVRLARAGDVAAYYRLMKDNCLLLDGFFLEDLPFTRTFQDTRLYLARVIHEAECNSRFVFVIEDHSSDRLIGSNQVRSLGRTARAAEIGYYLDREVTGKDILFRALGEVVNFCFYYRKINKLLYMPRESNRPGRNIAERNGFSYDRITHLKWQGDNEAILHIMQYRLTNPTNQ